MLSFFEVPRGVLEKLDYFRSRFFWQANNHKEKYRLVKWNITCQPKDQGGLGVKNLDVQNQCLLSKWLFKLINEEGMWQTLLKRKYLKDLPIGAVKRKPGDSQFWSGLMKVKHKFLDFIRFRVNNGTNTRFWEDRWVGNFKLKDRFPSLYNLTRKKGSSVAYVSRSVPLNVSFKRGLTGANHEAWFRLVSLVVVVQVNSAKDVGEWDLHQNKKFSVNSMYLALMSNLYYTLRLERGRPPPSPCPRSSPRPHHLPPCNPAPTRALPSLQSRPRQRRVPAPISRSRPRSLPIFPLPAPKPSATAALLPSPRAEAVRDRCPAPRPS
jgi:hypothetical protein